MGRWWFVACTLVLGIALWGGPAAAQDTIDADLKIYTDRLRKLLNAGEYSKGLEGAEQYVAAAKAKVGDADPRYARALNWLGTFHREKGNFAEAVRLFKQAIEIVAKSRGADDLSVADYLEDLVRVYLTLARFDEARPLAERALAITVKARGTEHPDVVRALTLVAELDEFQRRLPEAEDKLKRALAISEQAFGPDSPAAATSAVSIADFYRKHDRYDEAEALYKRALAIREKESGSESIVVAVTLSNLALLYSAQGRLTEALSLSTRALAIREKVLGPEHATNGRTLYNLGYQYKKAGRFAEADKLLQRAVAHGEKALGKDHIAVGTRLITLGEVYEAQGRLADAESVYRRAIEIHERGYGRDNPFPAFEKLLLAGVYKAMGRMSQAESVLLASSSTLERLLGPNHEALGIILAQLGDLYRQRGDCVKADPLFARAIAIAKGQIQEVSVLFGTDRKPTSKGTTVAFGSDTNRSLTLGLAVVTLPRPSGSEPPRARADAGPLSNEPRLGLRCIEIVKDQQLIDAAARRITVSQAFPNQAFVFVHGYNVSFDNAVRRSAQIAYDLKFDGGAFLFSWPSRGRFDVRSYLSDRDTVDLAATHLRQFLETVIAKASATKIHFVAHSMGNLVPRAGQDRQRQSQAA